MTSMIGTRHFVQDNQCLKTNDPILIRDDKVMNILSLVFNGEPCYHFSIFHLDFAVSYSGVICVKSSLPEDKLQDFTSLTTLNKGTLHYVLLILTENILVMKANAYNDKVFNKVENLILGFLDSVKDKINYKPCIMAPFFQIGTCDVGLVFKQVSISESSTATVGRPIVTMGQFNVALLGHIHDTLIIHNISKKEQQKGFITCYRFSGFIDGGSMMDKSYQECLADLKNMDIPQIRRLIQTFMMPYCKDEHVCGSLLEYAVEHRVGCRPFTNLPTKGEQTDVDKQTTKGSDGVFDGDTVDMIFNEIVKCTLEGISMPKSNKNDKNTAARHKVIGLLFSQKWSIATLFDIDGTPTLYEKTTVNIQQLLNTIDKDQDFITKSRDMVSLSNRCSVKDRAQISIEFSNDNIDIYRGIKGDTIKVYYKGMFMVEFVNLVDLLYWLTDDESYLQLFKFNLSKNYPSTVEHPKNHVLSLLHTLDKMQSTHYQNNIHDKGNMKVVRMLDLTSCQGTLTTEVSQILESQGAIVEEIADFFEQEIILQYRDDSTVVVSHAYNNSSLPIVYFVDLHNALEWLCKIGHYVFIYERFKSAKQAAAVAIEKFTPENSSQVGMSQQDSIQKNISLTEAFLEKEIPQLSDNFTLRIDFDQFLKQTQRHQYVHHKLNQERLILKDKSFPSIYRTPSFLRIVLSDNSQLDTEKNKTIVTKSCVVEFVYNESTVTKKAVLDFRMFKFNEYKREECINILSMYLEDITKVISSIVDHWKDIDKKKKAKQDEKTLLVKEKTEEKISRNVFDLSMNNFIRSTPSIPYSSCIVYHRLNLNDFAMAVETKNGANSKKLKKLYDDSVINTNDYLLFIDLEFMGKEKKFRLVTPGNTIVVDWTSERETILSYLYDKYINR